MSRTTIFVFLIMTMICIGHGFSQEINRSVIANGGVTSTNANFSVSATIGQPIIGISGNNANQIQAGFWSGIGEMVTGIESETEQIPGEFDLYQNYPNPFNPVTTIRFALPEKAAVALKVFDLLGRQVTTLVDEEMPAGVHKVIFDASALPTGVYFYRIRAGSFTEIKKLTLLK